MLNHDDCIAFVDKPLQDKEQFAYIFEMQAGGRLVENVDGFAGGAPLQLGRQLDSLRFTA